VRRVGQSGDALLGRLPAHGFALEAVGGPEPAAVGGVGIDD
jgi:hypothetical protein